MRALLAPVLAGCAALLLAGCAALKPGADEAVAVSDAIEAAVTAARAPAAERRVRLSAALESYAVQPDDRSRLHLAVLLATLPAPLRDDAFAATLLAPLAARQPESALTRFAGLLQTQVAERQRISQSGAGALRAGERREQALRRQIEALRAAERGMIEREERLGSRTR